MHKLEQAIGYTFQDKTLLEQALSHSSYANETLHDGLKSYERLEFLGDSILGFVAADYLSRSFPALHEGDLTKLRADLVCETSLSKTAQALELGAWLRLGRGEEAPGVGEIFALYILSEYYGTGLGRRLMEAGLERLRDYPRVCLWVLKENARAIRFYEKCGFLPDGAEMVSPNIGAAEIRMTLRRGSD